MDARNSPPLVFDRSHRLGRNKRFSTSFVRGKYKYKNFPFLLVIIFLNIRKISKIEKRFWNSFDREDVALWGNGRKWRWRPDDGFPLERKRKRRRWICNRRRRRWWWALAKLFSSTSPFPSSNGQYQRRGCVYRRPASFFLYFLAFIASFRTRSLSCTSVLIDLGDKAPQVSPFDSNSWQSTEKSSKPTLSNELKTRQQLRLRHFKESWQKINYKRTAN